MAARHAESEGARQQLLFEAGYKPAQIVYALSERMPPGVWAAILTLRRAGHTVYRRDTSHAVDGRQVDTRTLLRMARACKTSTTSSPA